MHLLEHGLPNAIGQCVGSGAGLSGVQLRVRHLRAAIDEDRRGEGGRERKHHVRVTDTKEG